MLLTYPTDWPTRRPRVLIFTIIGTACVVAGGVVAAVTGPTDWVKGSWVAAYLVLVTGVAQIGLGAGQAMLAPSAPSQRLVTGEWLAWNIGSLAVIVGTLVYWPPLVTAGGVVLAVALALFTIGVRGESHHDRGLLWGYRALLIIMLVSMPIGLTLSWIRN